MTSRNSNACFCIHYFRKCIGIRGQRNFPLQSGNHLNIIFIPLFESIGGTKNSLRIDNPIGIYGNIFRSVTNSNSHSFFLQCMNKFGITVRRARNSHSLVLVIPGNSGDTYSRDANEMVMFWNHR